MNLFPIYKTLKSYRLEGYKIIYINFVWLWVVLSVITSGIFMYMYIADKVGEYEYMKRNYSYYVNHPVELQSPSVITDILRIAKQPDPLDFSYASDSSYRQLNILRETKSLPLFVSVILKKSLTSNQWFLQIPKRFGDQPALYNKEWFMFCVIDTRILLHEKISNYEWYFETKVQFKDHKLYQLLTWAPAYFCIFFIGIICLLAIGAVCFLIVGLLSYLAVMFFVLKQFSHTPFNFNYFTSHRDEVKIKLIKNRPYCVLRTLGRIHFLLIE